MTTQNGDVGGFVRIKTEVVDDEYEAAKSDLSGGQAPSFAVYIDNAHALSSPGHLQLGCIKEEPVAFPVDSSLVLPDMKDLKDEAGNSTDDNMEDQSDNIIQHSTKDSGEKIAEIPDSFQSAVNWEVVKVFKRPLAAPCVKSSDTRENVRSFDSNFSDSSAVPYPKPGSNLSNKIIKEEIIDKEYDMESTSAKASRRTESSNVDETWLHSENLTHVPVKEELVSELTNDDTVNESLGNEDSRVSAKREVDAHDPARVLTSCLSNDRQRKAATNCCFFQRKFEQYVTNRNTDETNTTPQHEDSRENNDPFRLPKTGEKETQTPRTLYKHSPPESPPSMETDLVISPGLQPAENISLSLPKRGRKRQGRKTLSFKVHVCTVCSTQFDSHKELKAHSFVHKRKYRRYSKLLKMMKSTPSTGVTALFPCRFCRKSFTFAADLTRHLESHEEQRWYETVFTKYQLSWNQVKNLNRPACEPSAAAGRTEKSSEEKADDKLHAGRDAYACMVCGSLFPTDLALRMHMHHPEKPVLIENPQLLAPATDHQKPTISNQKRLLQFAKPHTFSERGGVLVHSKERSQPEISNGEHGPEKTAKDGSEHNEDSTPLNVNIPGSLSNLPAMDSDRGQTADETFTSGRKRKRENSSQQDLHTLSPLYAHCDREKENERRGDTSQGTRPHIDHANALVESSIKKRKNKERFVSCAHLSEAENYSGTKTVDSVQSENSQRTGDIGKKSDVNTLVHGPGDHQITFHCSSKPDIPPPFVRDESSSNEISSLNEQSATVKSQTCDRESCLLWEGRDAVKISLTCKQSSWGDLPSSGLPFLGEHWCPHLSMVKRPEAHCEVRHADGSEANCSKSTCPYCKKNEDTHEHLRRLSRHDDSASGGGLHAQPLTTVWSACHASDSLRRDVTTRGASHTHGNATEDKGPDKAQTQVSSSHRLFRHWHRRGVFTCRYCSGVFDSRQGLSAHQRIHIKTMPYDCNQCTQRFHTRVDLQAHQRWHLGSSPCVCVFCSAVFSSVKGLNHHLTKYKRENMLAGNSCHTSHSIPVPSLAQTNESAPFRSSVNCRSELLSTWLICPLSSPDMSLGSKSNTTTHSQAGGNALNISEEDVRSNNGCTTETVHRSSVSLGSHVSSGLPVSSAATAADRSLTSGGPFTENAPLSTAHAIHGETSSRNKTSAQQITDQNWCIPAKQQVLEKRHRKGRPTRHDKDCFRPLTDETVCTGAEGKEKRHRKGPHKVRCRKRNRCKSSQNTSHYTCIKTMKHGNAVDNAEQRVSLKHIEAELEDVGVQRGVREDALRERCMPTDRKKAECPEEASVLIMPGHDTAYLCPDCQNSFPDKLGFDQHLHVQDSQHKYLTCFVCPQSFACYRALERHVAEHTSERGSCTFLFPGPSPLSVGAGRADPQVAQSSEVQSSLSRDLMCSFCGRTFLNGRGLWKHTESHTPGKRCKGRKKRTFTMRK